MLANRSDIATSSLSKVETGVIRTLLYFDIFSYPLTREEIVDFLPQRIEALAIHEVLSSLLKQHLIFKMGEYYSLRQEQELIERRVAGNTLASKRLKTAKIFGKLIAKFPFVRAVMLSGSISKNYMEESSDIDYFVVTAPKKVWLVRGLLAIFKRTFLFNSHKFFCTNYFIDTDSLEIEEKNIYTAVEISTLLPVSGNEVYEKFLNQNEWIKNHLPNSHPQICLLNIKYSLFQKLSEKILSRKIGDRLNNFFYQAGVKRWNEKYQKEFTAEDYRVAFKTRKNISKIHPHFYQKKTLDNYSLKIQKFENLYNLNLSA